MQVIAIFFLEVILDQCINKAKASCHKAFISNSSFDPSPHNVSFAPNTQNIAAHYSFDMAHQVFYPKGSPSGKTVVAYLS